MFRRRLGLLAVFVSLVVAAGALYAIRSPDPASAQVAGSTMEHRLAQVIDSLDKNRGPAATEALDHALEILYGGIRVLPTKGLEPETQQADQALSAAEMELAEALERYTKKGKLAEARDRAMDMKLFIEQMNEVARAVGEITEQCGQGDSINVPPCDQLQPLLDEDQGGEFGVGAFPGGNIIGPGFSLKLRSPFVPPWFVNPTWQEDVRVTEPIADGECAVIFKETTGLMLRLRFVRITVVRDPWVATFGVPRGTPVPVWQLELVPSEYGKEWNICNDGGLIVKTITQRVVQDVPLNYFWRYYPKDP